MLLSLLKRKGLVGLKCLTSHLLFLEEDVDRGEIFAIVVGLQLSLQAAQPLVEVGTALRKQLGLVGIEQTLGFGLGGGLKILPHCFQGRQFLFNHGLCLWLLCHQGLPILKTAEASVSLLKLVI